MNTRDYFIFSNGQHWPTNQDIININTECSLLESNSLSVRCSDRHISVLMWESFHYSQAMKDSCHDVMCVMWLWLSSIFVTVKLFIKTVTFSVGLQHRSEPDNIRLQCWIYCLLEYPLLVERNSIKDKRRILIERVLHLPLFSSPQQKNTNHHYYITYGFLVNEVVVLCIKYS